jgi:hypothetical protein
MREKSPDQEQINLSLSAVAFDFKKNINQIKKYSQLAKVTFGKFNIIFCKNLTEIPFLRIG